MPWFPDFISAVEQARMETRAAARADPVAQYIRALNEGTTHDLETAWPGEVIVHDPRSGTIRGHRLLRLLGRQRGGNQDRQRDTAGPVPSDGPPVSRERYAYGRGPEAPLAQRQPARTVRVENNQNRTSPANNAPLASATARNANP